MDLQTARDALTEWASNTLMFAEELGADTAATNQAILTAAIAQIESASNIAAFMATVEGQIAIYDLASEDGSDIDNSGAVIITDDGREIGYGEYLTEFGIGEGSDETGADAYGLGFIGGTPSVSLADLLANPLDERETAPIIGLVQYESAA